MSSKVYFYLLEGWPIALKRWCPLFTFVDQSHSASWGWQLRTVVGNNDIYNNDMKKMNFLGNRKQRQLIRGLRNSFLPPPPPTTTTPSSGIDSTGWAKKPSVLWAKIQIERSLQWKKNLPEFEQQRPYIKHYHFYNQEESSTRNIRNLYN